MGVYNLLDCPFCGGKAEIITTKTPMIIPTKDGETEVRYFKEMFVSCRKCGATGSHIRPSALSGSEARKENVTARIVDAWNSIHKDNLHNPFSKIAANLQTQCERTTNAKQTHNANAQRITKAETEAEE